MGQKRLFITLWVHGTMNRLRSPRRRLTRVNGLIRSQLASSQVPTAEVVEDNDVRMIAKWESWREEEEFHAVGVFLAGIH